MMVDQTASRLYKASAMQIWYNFESCQEQTREPYSDDSWDRGDTSTTWTAPTSVYASEHHGAYDTDEIDDVPVGTQIFLVWVQYGTGDTFGHDAGYNHEVIGWYLNEKDANTAEEAVDSSTGGTVNVPTFDGSGTRPQYCGSWHGYFESFDFCRVETVTVCP